jgi:hypothetical protein
VLVEKGKPRNELVDLRSAIGSVLDLLAQLAAAAE